MSKLSSTSVCITQPSFGYSEEYILLLRKSSAYSSAGPGQILDNIKCDKCAAGWGDHPSGTNRSRQPTMPPFILSTYSCILHTLSRAEGCMQDTFLWKRTWYVIYAKLCEAYLLCPNVMLFLHSSVATLKIKDLWHDVNMTIWQYDMQVGQNAYYGATSARLPEGQIQAGTTAAAVNW